MITKSNSDKTVRLEELYKSSTNTLSAAADEGIIQKQRQRYGSLAEGFAKQFGRKCGYYFSSPGRTEIIGNHTDHNGGRVIAAAVNMDTIAAISPNEENVIRIFSRGYGSFTIALSNNTQYNAKAGGECRDITIDSAAADKQDVRRTAGLTAGIIDAIRLNGYHIGGFDAYITSDVIPSAGVSSSASYEMLICTVVNRLFNEGSISDVLCARFGQYAENTCWNKSSGLMDQLACAVGGAVCMDFADVDDVKYEKTDFSFAGYGMQLVIVNTGAGHASLDAEYSSVPLEMKNAAARLGCTRLCETDLQTLIDNAAAFDNDREFLRAVHFFEENRRVDEMAAALTGHSDDMQNDNSGTHDMHTIEKVLRLLWESGDSSWRFLQNCYCVADCKSQPIAKALAMSELYLKNTGGTCRIHGGGFAGVIVAVVPDEHVRGYADYMSGVFGSESIYMADIRRYGAVEVVL